jgi:hypothetical protein
MAGSNNEAPKQQIPVIDGWLHMDMGDPHLIGNRCRACGDFFFPKARLCRNPECGKMDLEDVLLSNRAKVWSFTLNYYQPPPPYVPKGEFAPYGIVVAELVEEKLMIMAPLADHCEYEQLQFGMDVEMVFEPLYRDAEGNDHIIWKWKPVEG